MEFGIRDTRFFSVPHEQTKTKKKKQRNFEPIIGHAVFEGHLFGQIWHVGQTSRAVMASAQTVGDASSMNSEDHPTSAGKLAEAGNLPSSIELGSISIHSYKPA